MGKSNLCCFFARWFICAAVAILASLAVAGGKRTTVPQYKLTLVDTGNGGKVRGLLYQPSPVQPPQGIHKIDGHVVSFTLQVDPVNGAPEPADYGWTPSTGGQGAVTEGLLVFSGTTHGRTCTGYAWSTGVKGATCTIHVDGFPDAIDVSTDVLVIGGPLVFRPSGSYVVKPIPPNFPLPDVPLYDPDTKAVHLQFFGNLGTIENYEQLPQHVIVSWQEYPDGGSLTYLWGLPSFVEDPAHPEASGGQPISTGGLDLRGTSAGGPAAVTCTMFATYTDMQGVECSGSAERTIGTLIDPIDPTHPIVTTTVAVHVPTTIVEGAGTLGNDTQGVSGHNSAKWHVLMVVSDQNGDAMPGVAVQERYPNGTLPGFSVNGTGSGWNTRKARSARQLLTCAGFHDDGQLTWSSVASVSGSFNGFDNLSYIWETVPTESTMHQYWAGTLDTATGAHGVNFGDWSIVFTANATLGLRGSVTHGGNTHGPP